MTTGTKTAKSPDGKVHEPQFGRVPPALMHDLSVTDGAVRLYAHMFWRYGQNHDNHEGHGSMARHMGVSETTISNRIEELEYNDWLVVVENERDKESGNFRTPFYHVFIEQKDCREFRKTYKCAEGESIHPKPTEVRQKKSRKGKGGKPANIIKFNEANQSNSSQSGQSNSSWNGENNSDQSNSSQSRGTNSSWSNLDASYLDTSLNTPPLPPKGDGVVSDSHAPSDPFEGFVETMDIPEPSPVPETPPDDKPKAAPISDEQTALMLINAFLIVTNSADKSMLREYHYKIEALDLYEKGMRPYHIGVYVRRMKAEKGGLWEGRNVTWKTLIGQIVTHFEEHPVATVIYEPEPESERRVTTNANVTTADLEAALEAAAKHAEGAL